MRSACCVLIVMLAGCGGPASEVLMSDAAVETMAKGKHHDVMLVHEVYSSLGVEYASAEPTFLVDENGAWVIPEAYRSKLQDAVPGTVFTVPTAVTAGWLRAGAVYDEELEKLVRTELDPFRQAKGGKYRVAATEGAKQLIHEKLLALEGRRCQVFQVDKKTDVPPGTSSAAPASLAASK